MQLHHSLINRAFALLAVALVPGVAGCERNEAGTTIEEVRDWPNAYIGDIITAVGEVEEVHSSGAFTLDGKGTWWNDNILVIMPREQMMTLSAGGDVRVTGEIQRLVVAEVERDYGLDLEADIETRFHDQPILIARSIKMLDAG